MILQRIVGGRGSGKTTLAIGQAFTNSPPAMRSLYVCRNMQDADRCYRLFIDRWRGATFKRYEIEWQTSTHPQTRIIRFASESTFDPAGHDIGDVTIDLPLADLGIRFLDHVMMHMQGTLTIVAGDPWQRDMRAWRQFKLHCGDAFKRKMLLTTCHSPGRTSQVKVPLVIGQRKPFLSSIWLPQTPEVIEFRRAQKYRFGE